MLGRFVIGGGGGGGDGSCSSADDGEAKRCESRPLQVGTKRAPQRIRPVNIQTKERSHNAANTLSSAQHAASGFINNIQVTRLLCVCVCFECVFQVGASARERVRRSCMCVVVVVTCSLPSPICVCVCTCTLYTLGANNMEGIGLMRIAPTKLCIFIPHLARSHTVAGVPPSRSNPCSTSARFAISRLNAAHGRNGGRRACV